MADCHSSLLSSSSFDAILPDDILAKILSLLPILTLIRSKSVCKRWRLLIHTRKHSWNNTTPTQTPWYFMYTFPNSSSGHAYDPILRKWRTFSFPCLHNPNWPVSSSSGLVSFMDYNQNRIFICNPITRDCRQIPQPLTQTSPDYISLALAVDRPSLAYQIAVVRSKQLPHDFQRWDFSIQTYDSATRRWAAPTGEVLDGWRGGEECVICAGILYCLLYSFSGNNERRHGLVMHELRRSEPALAPVMGRMIAAPCQLTCGRLMNVGEKVVMVGGIGRRDRPDVMKGIGIWELEGEGWREVGRMPQKFFQGFGELDDVFAGSGAGDAVFIQCYGAPAVAVFEMGGRRWRWAGRCPATKRFALQLFTGFCFEPRLEVPPY